MYSPLRSPVGSVILNDRVMARATPSRTVKYDMLNYFLKLTLNSQLLQQIESDEHLDEHRHKARGLPGSAATVFSAMSLELCIITLEWQLKLPYSEQIINGCRPREQPSQS